MVRAGGKERRDIIFVELESGQISLQVYRI